MFEKMTPNQRLLTALVLSFLFFFAYSSMFPPQPQETEAPVETSASEPKLKSEPAAAPAVAPADFGHTVRPDEQIAQTTSSTLATIETEAFTLEIDTLGRIASKRLKDAKFFDGDGNPAELIPDFGAKPLFVRFADETLNRAATSVAYVSDITKAAVSEGNPATVTLVQELPGLSIKKQITFYNDGHYDVNIALSDEKRYFVYLGSRPQISDNMMTVHGAMVYNGDGLFNIFEEGEMEGRSMFTDVHLVSAFDQYYASLFYGLNPDTGVVVERDRDDNPVSYLDGTREMAFKGFIGPKDYRLLESIDPVLVNAIEYGWFTFAAKPLFSVLMWLEGIFGNWGWAIVGLTILIRIVLYPLTYKGMMSMQKIKEIAPKIKELQTKHKGDPQRMNAAVMEMYRKHGANPLGGCLPLLLQIPVFFAIYRVLLNAVELEGAPWILWIEDLSRLDPYFVLPILMGATMYYQQRITPSNFTDPLQEKLFKFLPVIFTFFFITFPAGLVLYWFVNNLFSIAQQYLVNRQFEAAREARHAKHLAEKDHGQD